MALVKPEISVVLALISPLADPITHYAFSVAGTIVSSQSSVTTLTTAATSVTNVSYTLVSPSQGVVASLM